MLCMETMKSCLVIFRRHFYLVSFSKTSSLSWFCYLYFRSKSKYSQRWLWVSPGTKTSWVKVPWHPDYVNIESKGNQGENLFPSQCDCQICRIGTSFFKSCLQAAIFYRNFGPAFRGLIPTHKAPFSFIRRHAGLRTDCFMLNMKPLTGTG